LDGLDSNFRLSKDESTNVRIGPKGQNQQIAYIVYFKMTFDVSNVLSSDAHVDSIFDQIEQNAFIYETTECIRKVTHPRRAI